MAARGDQRDGPSDPLIGRTIAGRYLVRRAIGRGGMGAVYEALHVGLDRRVALKVILERHAEDREAVERFHREARTASRIGNQHIIQITDVGQSDGGQSYIAMEYLDGHDLGHVLRAAGALDPSRAIHIMEQVLLGLEAAHAEGIIHRDLKPENVFLTERDGAGDFAVLMDFGISKVLAAEEERVRLTHTGVVVGTPLYMAPEQALGEPDLDHRVDLYAAGVMLYEMLAGRPPFEGPSYAALVAQHLTEPPPFLAGLRPGLPSGLVSAVHRALEKRRDDRYATAGDLRDALLAAAADLPDPSTHDHHPTSSMTAPPAPSDARGAAELRANAAPAGLPGIAAARGNAAPVGLPGLAAARGNAAPVDAPGAAAPRENAAPSDARRIDALRGNAEPVDAPGAPALHANAAPSDARGAAALRANAAPSDARGADARRANAAPIDAPGIDARRANAAPIDAPGAAAPRANAAPADAPGAAAPRGNAAPTDAPGAASSRGNAAPIDAPGIAARRGNAAPIDARGAAALRGNATPTDAPGAAAAGANAAPIHSPGAAAPGAHAAAIDSPGATAPRADAAAPGIAAPMQIEVPVFRPPPRRSRRAAARIALIGGGIASALAVGVWRGATGEDGESGAAAAVGSQPEAAVAREERAGAGAAPTATGAGSAARTAAGASSTTAGGATTAAGAAPSPAGAPTTEPGAASTSAGAATTSAPASTAAGAAPTAAGATTSAGAATTSAPASTAAGAAPTAPSSTTPAGAAPTVSGAASGAAASGAVLEIDSGPRGAHVFVDGVHRGRTPVRLEDVAVGDHRIRLEMRGYQLVQADKVVRAGATETFFAALARRGSGRPGSISSGGRVPGGDAPAARPDPAGSSPASPGPDGDAKSNPYLELRRRSP